MSELLDAVKKRYSFEGAVPIAKEFGVPAQNVRAIAHYHGIKVVKDTTCLEELRRAVLSRYAAEGSSLLASEFGVSRQYVNKVAAKLGCRTDSKGVQTAARHAANRAANLNVCFFRTWSAEMAYVLGYTWADGCVAAGRDGLSLVYGCVTEDEEILRYVADCLGCSRSPRRQPGGKRADGINAKPYSRLQICCKEMAEDLGGIHGVVPRKSFLDPTPRKVPREYLADFVRGFFDGDGCVSFKKRCDRVTAGFCGTPSLVRWVRDVTSDRIGIKKPAIVTSRPTTHIFEWSTVEDVGRLYAFLYYPGHPFSLKRKREKLASFLSRKGWSL